MVRESITAWRDEALSGFVSQPVATKAKRKSALAALRQFFDLSPLWLKGATAFAVGRFVCLQHFALVKLRSDNGQVNSTHHRSVYTEQDVNGS